MDAKDTSEKSEHSPIGHQQVELVVPSDEKRGGDVPESQKIWEILHGSYNRWNVPEFDSAPSVFPVATENLTQEEFVGTGVEQLTYYTMDTSQLVAFNPECGAQPGYPLFTMSCSAAPYTESHITQGPQGGEWMQQQYFMPTDQVQAASGDSSAHQICFPTSSPPQGVVSKGSPDFPYNPHPLTKKELRLMKNREAARLCRRNKKAYIRRLEDRVATLEKQNKELLSQLNEVKSRLRSP